jgi:hypothetical protein
MEKIFQVQNLSEIFGKNNIKTLLKHKFMKQLSIFTLLLLASAGVFSQENTDRTIMSFSAEFDTLRHVGYNYVFGTDNPSEYQNAISFGVLEFKDAKVGPVNNCVYETLFNNSVIQSVTLRTDNKTNSTELYEYTSKIYPDFPGLVFLTVECDIKIYTVLNSKPVCINYVQSKKGKNAELIISLDKRQLN